MTPEEQIKLLVVALKHTEASIQVAKIATEIGMKTANCRYHLKKLVETDTGHILDGQSRVREKGDTAAAANTNNKAGGRKRKAEGSAKASPATPVNAKRPRAKKTYTEDGGEDSDGDESTTTSVSPGSPQKMTTRKLEDGVGDDGED